MKGEHIEIGESRLYEAGDTYEFHITGNPLEIARALEEIRRAHGYTYEELSKNTHFSKGQISKYLKLLRLEPGFQRLLESDEMAWSTGYVLAGLPEEERARFLDLEDRITFKKAEEARREHNIRDLYGLLGDISEISEGVESVSIRNIGGVTCPKCGHSFHPAPPREGPRAGEAR